MMKKRVFMILIVVLLLVASISGFVFAQDSFGNYGFNSMMGQGYSNNNGFNFGSMGSMMRGFFNQSNLNENNEPYPVEDLTLEVEKFLAHYGDDLVIEDIFIFEDSDYYYSVVEKSTGKGAMELLVNPYTKAIYPEFGPNMMWNLKYGMHSGGGMMGNSYMGRGMMGNYYTSYNDSNEGIVENTISSDEAYKKAEAYLAKYYPEISLGDDDHEFYGYYTFHVMKEGQPFGMLSVNGFTGYVWYHDWHGSLIDVIENEIK